MSTFKDVYMFSFTGREKIKLQNYEMKITFPPRTA
jgi:hypothetical protein